MKKKIYDHIKEYGPVTVSDIFTTLNICGNHAFKLIEDLRANGFLRMRAPRPLSVNSDNSCFYITTGKEYQE
ncbi:MAG: hypothetical protein IJZ56_06515 [Oscillospiraceae bacterium]|nr:hypothetical protein [Oscillospiraceae bacterium]